MKRWTWGIALVVAWRLSARADTIDTANLAERLTWRWAPVYVQHVDDHDGGADRPTRIDFDGNWNAKDNWSHQGERRTALPPAAYGAAVLTATHAYLTYTLYYPRDWSSFCISFVCHDNDLETVQLVVERGRGDGRLVEIRAKAHFAIKDTAGGAVARSADDRPILRVESKGHGIAPCKPNDPACAPRPGRIVYAPGPVASAPPTAARGQTIQYELLSMHETLWARRHRSHDDLWEDGETGPLSYVGRFRGRLGNVMGASMGSSRYLGGVRPPWALKGSTGKRGDWFLDPAATKQGTSEYVYNPYLKDLAAECRGPRCSPAPKREPTRFSYFVKLAAPYAVFSLGAVLVGGTILFRAKPLRF